MGGFTTVQKCANGRNGKGEGEGKGDCRDSGEGGPFTLGNLTAIYDITSEVGGGVTRMAMAMVIPMTRAGVGVWVMVIVRASVMANARRKRKPKVR